MPSKPYKTKVYQLSKNTPAAFLHPGVFPHPYLLSSLINLNFAALFLYLATLCSAKSSVA